ncbi:MAG TPA: phenylalanine--tRNA ligase subunit alpha [Candidatus Acidoferrum sp.]|jgi:phenylalanyl-tRNA synthetase alpha chain|nr:phenylalanine--tRNA ligase subunit alpha [Candidatus Acidoferrum sp.]
MESAHELISDLEKLSGLQLQHFVIELSEKARAEAQLSYSNEQQDQFLQKWYGREPGLAWIVFDRTYAKDRSAAAWARYGLQNLFKVPADLYINYGILAEDPEEAFDHLRAFLKTLIARANHPERFAAVRSLWESRNQGIKTAIREHLLKNAKSDIKPRVGQYFNQLSSQIEELLAQTQLITETDGAEEAALAKERVDLSLPGVIRPIGSRHLIRQVLQEVEDIFFSIGFSVVEGPEIETPYYNFEALNIPEFHPVRDDMDTFYLELPKGTPEPLLLRTHTSPMQIRTMEKRQPPVRVIVPGKVYRRDNPDATHSFIFHQVEGLAVDTDITFCDFTGTIEYFVKQFFGPGVKTRFRPSYFPFTEPSVEFDVSCIFCGGSGTAAGGGTCSKCKGSGWIELFGAGMVDPAVYGFVNYDAKKVSGFAFGMGIDRLAMLKYGIDDIQVFFQNDARFLRQFP